MSDPSGWHRRTPTPADAARRAEYDSAAYRRERARLGREVKAGRAYCWRCGQHIPPGSKWHTGHIDDRSTVMGAEYAGCNVRTAASKGARTANANRKARKAGLLRPASKPAPTPLRCRPHLAAGVTDCGGIHSGAW